MEESKLKFHRMPRYLMRRHAIEKILSKVQCSNKDLLEIGYGAGDIFSLYEKLKLKMYGYDFSDTAYNYATNNINNKNVTLYKEESEIIQRKYDIVAAYEVLEHIEDDEDAIKLWKSYLKPNGKLLISVPAHQNRWGANDKYSGHFRRYSKSDLISLLNKANLKVNYIYTYDFPSNIILDPIRDYEVGKKLKNIKNSSDKESLTKTSGIDRSENKFFVLLSNQYLLTPLIKFQELFYKTDFGSAFIVMATNHED